MLVSWRLFGRLRPLASPRLRSPVRSVVASPRCPVFSISMARRRWLVGSVLTVNREEPTIVYHFCMAVDFDPNRLPGKVEVLEDLVNVIGEAGDSEGERSWLEWKSVLDLKRAEGRFKLAKEILAFANRDVQEAQRFCHGWAYVVVGASEEGINGIREIRTQEVEQALASYLGRGREAPRWEPVFISPDSQHNVLVVKVAPPQDGDPIYSLKKDFAGCGQGTVFVRGVEESRPADPGQLRTLQRRLLAGSLRDRVMERMSLVCTSLHVDVNFSPLLPAYHGFAEIVHEHSGRSVTIWAELLSSGSFDERSFLRGMIRPLPSDHMLVIIPDYLPPESMVKEVEDAVEKDYGRIRNIHGGTETGKVIAICDSSFGSIHAAIRELVLAGLEGNFPMRSAVLGVGVPDAGSLGS